MPGFNQQGPLGTGPMMGRQQGMCRRTEELSVTAGGGGRGRGMGGRRTQNNPSGEGVAQRGRKFAQGAEVAAAGSESAVDKELADLKKQYLEASESLAKIASRIEALEAKV